LAALAAELLLEGRAVILVAGGRSMAPSIRDGASVLLEPVRALPGVGDVVLLRSGDRLLLHRVVRRCAEGVVTRGDGAGGDDGLIAPEQVFGRAMAVSGRRPLHLRPPFGRLAIALLRLRRSRLFPEPLRALARGVRGLATVSRATVVPVTGRCLILLALVLCAACAGRGREVFVANGCIGCHRFRGEGGEAGPDLTNVASRKDSAAIRAQITNPGAGSPSSRMPAFKQLSWFDLQSLVAYLRS
jgi:cytochrome c2